MRIVSIFFSMMTLGILLGISPVLAAEETTTTQTETVAENAEATAAVESLAAEAESVTQTYEGIEVEKPTKAPSGFGSFWRNIKENVSLAVTFDPNKKAEKAIKFAEERMLIAEKVLLSSTDEKAKEKAGQHLERAKKMMAKADVAQEKALLKPTKDTERLLSNRAKQFEHQKEIFDRLEEKSDGEALESVLKFREEIVDQGKALENALSNENISEEVRAHLKEVQSNIQEHAAEIKQRMAEFGELKAAAEGGDEKAVKKLEAFKEGRKKEVKMRVEEQQEKMGNIDEKMNKIREAAEGGDEQAQKMFDQMQDRPEFKERMEEMFGDEGFPGRRNFKEGPEDGNNQAEGDRQNPPPGFKNRPNGERGSSDENNQGQNKPDQANGEAVPAGIQGKNQQPPPGFFGRVKGFLNREGENQQPQEKAESGALKTTGDQMQATKQKPEGVAETQPKPEQNKPGFFSGVKNFLDRKDRVDQKNPAETQSSSDMPVPEKNTPPPGAFKKGPEGNTAATNKPNVSNKPMNVPGENSMNQGNEGFIGGAPGKAPGGFDNNNGNKEPQGGAFSPPSQGGTVGGKQSGSNFGGSAPGGGPSGGPQGGGNFGGVAPQGGPGGGGVPGGGGPTGGAGGGGSVGGPQ